MGWGSLRRMKWKLTKSEKIQQKCTRRAKEIQNMQDRCPKVKNLNKGVEKIFRVIIKLISRNKRGLSLGSFHPGAYKGKEITGPQTYPRPHSKPADRKHRPQRGQACATRRQMVQLGYGLVASSAISARGLK